MLLIFIQGKASVSSNLEATTLGNACYDSLFLQYRVESHCQYQNK